MTLYILALIIAFGISTISMPIIIKISKKRNLFDRIDDRKVHTGQISRLGGIGITIGFSIALAILYFSGLFSTIQQNIWYLLGAGLCISAMGIIDDLKALSAKLKLLIQVVAAILVLIGGFKFTGIAISSVFYLNFSFFSYIITFCWIIGVTNAYNLIDGIDGLCGGIASFASLTFAFIFFKSDNIAAIFICLSLASAVFGFLLFNWPLPKAKIFMGDGGSQFLGFVLAVLPLLSSKGSMPTISLPYAIAVLMIPIFDTIAAIWRRLREKRRIDSPDRFHIHHKLMLLGFSSRSTMVILYLLQAIICIFLASAYWLGGYISVFILLADYLTGVLFFTIIHIGKNQALKTDNQEA